MKSTSDFSAIEAFARVAEAGSFRTAAAALGAPASTISIRVSRLEKSLGAKLFTRTTRRVTLTEEGRLYFERVRSALGTMEEAERMIASRSATARGRLRVAAPTDLGQTALGRVLGRYMQCNPDVDVEVELTHAPIDLVRDGHDVALTTEPPDSSSLIARKVGAPMRYRLLASPAYLARAGTPKHPSDLAAHSCLVMGSRSAPAVWRFQKGSARHSLAHQHVTANSWPIVRDLAVAGCGIARLPDYLAIPALADGSLVTVLDSYGAPAEQMYAVYSRSEFVPLRISAFVAELKAFLDVWPGCLAER